MMSFAEIVQWQTLSGQSTTIDRVTVTPQSQALIIRWPFGGFVWNRPVAVVVEWGDGTERIPITDVTLLAQLGLWGLGMVFAVLAVLISNRPGRE